MKRILLALLLPLTGFASIQTDVDGLIQKVDSSINIGVEVVDLSSGKTLYKKNAHRWFTPASNMKLYSDAAALIMMGPDYRFPTQLLTDARRIKRRHLKGNLYLVSHGSPSFSHQNLQALLAKLSDYGLKAIDGNVIIVNQSIKAKPHAPGWMVDDLRFGYGAPITPISLDANRVKIIINPAAKLNQQAVIENADGTPDSVRIKSLVKTVEKSHECRFEYDMNSLNELTVDGCIGRSQLAEFETGAINNPFRYAKFWLERSLKEAKIKLNGRIQMGNLSSRAVLLDEHLSPPMQHLIARTLKPSDNLYADSLFLKVGEVFYHRPATWRSAQVAVKKVLEKYLGLNLTRAVLVDGSGLSRYDLISPHQTVELLGAMHKVFPIAYEFAAALPVSGRDGTLQRRLVGENQKDLVRAKTGGMMGVVSLSGYLTTPNHHLLAFSILINGISGQSHRYLSRYRQLEDKLCNYFLKLRPKNHLLSPLKTKKRQLFPYEKKYSHAQLQREKRRTLNNLEFHLKKTLAQNEVLIKRHGNYLELDMGRVPAKLKAKINKLRKHYDFWLEIKGQNEEKLAQLGFRDALLNLNSRHKLSMRIHLQS